MPEAPLFVEMTLGFVVFFVLGLAAYGCWECRCWEKAWRETQRRLGGRRVRTARGSAEGGGAGSAAASK